MATLQCKILPEMNRIYNYLLLALLAVPVYANAQYQLPDSTALEGIIVETYYISDTLDVTDEDGGFLDTCSVTYRIYVDMKPDYRLQAVYGNENNLLQLQTSTVFFNNEDRGEVSGDLIGANFLEDNTVALDSWVAMGAASNAHWGVLKSEDMDGSIIGGANNDGGSEGISEGLLVNNNDLMNEVLTEYDGLFEGTVPTVTTVGLDLGIFNDESAGSLFESNGGAWSVLEGVTGPTEENKVLIAQITTQGTFSFRLNIQLGIPQELQCGHPDCHATIQYVAVLSNADAVQSVDTDNIFQRDELSFVSEAIICYPGTTISVGEVSNELGFDVYPNPADNQLNVAVNSNENGALQLEVYNTVGQLVMTNQVYAGAHQIDITELEAGMYVAVIRSEKGSSQKQFVKN